MDELVKVNNDKSDKGDHRTYILTFDWGEKIAQLRSVGIKTPDPWDNFFVNTREKIVKIVEKAFPNSQIRSIAMKELAEEILASALKKMGSLHNSAIVSTCVEIADSARGRILEINRIYDYNGDFVGLGPRPGHPNLNEQVRAIKSVTHGCPVILIEDGVFSGTTVSYILEIMKNADIFVEVIVVGFIFPKAMKKIKEIFDGEIIVVEELGDCIDWMPDHDFFPFAPNCGRVLGLSWDGINLPLYTHDGASYAVPYLEPYCPMTEWTSIPHDQALELSMFCMERANELFHHLNQINGRQIIIRDLIKVMPRISIPLGVKQSGFIRLDEVVSSYLGDICHEF